MTLSNQETPIKANERLQNQNHHGENEPNLADDLSSIEGVIVEEDEENSRYYNNNHNDDDDYEEDGY
jgi:hypothetical protein